MVVKNELAGKGRLELPKCLTKETVLHPESSEWLKWILKLEYVKETLFQIVVKYKNEECIQAAWYTELFSQKGNKG